MSELDEALEQLDAETVLDMRGVDYRGQHGTHGWQLNIKDCPRCGNSNWKVYIGAETGLGNCFRCDETYNLFSFIRDHEGLSNRDAAEAFVQMAREVGWMPRQKTRDVQFKAELVLPDRIELPDKNGANLQYLKDRRVDDYLTQYFRLSYCHSGRFNYTLAGDLRYQDYSGRVIIPVFDLDGNLVSFQGRDITGTAEKKYLFPVGHSSTASVLYNAHNAIGAERICVGEGVFDVIAIKRALDEDPEFRQVVPVGSFGKNFTIRDTGGDQLAIVLKLIKQGLKEVVFMWDGEKDAIKAAINAALELKRYGLITRVAILPSGKDPDEAGDAVVRAAFRASKKIDEMTAAMMLMQYG